MVVGRDYFHWLDASVLLSDVATPKDQRTGVPETIIGILRKHSH